MQHWHEEIRIEAPVEHVWEYAIDPSHFEDWMPRAKFSDFSGPLDEVGTTYVQSMRLMGFEMKQNVEVVEVEPLRLYHEHSDTGPMDTYFRLEPDGDATKFIAESDFEMPGVLPGFIKDLMTKGWMERQGRQMLADFKALAEANVPTKA
jgi:uncharacterized protein YndB with AHSA1/START domain